MNQVPNKITIETQLQRSEEYPTSAFFVFDFDFMAVFGSKGRIPVWLIVGEHRYQSTIAVYSGVHMMVFNAQMRLETGYKAGDIITITLERDTSIRTVQVPQDVKDALVNGGTWECFNKLSYTHQKEHIDRVNDAKKPETRERRIAKLVADLWAKSQK